MGGGEFRVHLFFSCHGLKGVVKPTRSLTGKGGHNLSYIIHQGMYDN